MPKFSARIRLRILRAALYIGLAVLGLILLPLLLFKVGLPISAALFPSQKSFFYELGAFGVYPTARYVTLPSNVTVPSGQWAQWDESCDDGSLVLLAPFGTAVNHPGPIILDARGELVWASTDRFFDTTTNFNVQTYNDTAYLTFWAGNKQGGEGSGAAYMLDANYRVHQVFRGVGENLRTDLHEFSLTPDGHALFSNINESTADLRALGGFRGANGPIEDSVLQEFDIATGELVFEWRASDHFEPAESFYRNSIGGYSLLQSFDFFHLNAAQKDAKGNYLISARHYHEILYVDGTTGDVIWTLGGKSGRNDFTDLSDGQATDFTWQHHAQWQPQEDGIITVMDNAAGTDALQEKPISHALMLQIDQDNRTVELLHSYTIDWQVQSQCSVQVLPNDHVLVGWGPVATFTEHDIDGDVMCQFDFAARWFFSRGWVKNYRTFKVFDWHSTPDYPPTAKTKDGKVYVSWNGATEVASWRLEGAEDPAANGVYHDIETVEKQGFESSFEIPEDLDYTFLRVAALDADQNVLGVSPPAEEAEDERSVTSVVFGVLFMIGVLLGGVIVYRMWARRRRQEGSRQAAWELFDWNQPKYTPLSDEER